jgi:hypothetical protein
VARFNALVPDQIQARLSALQAILSSQTWGEGVLPFLPIIPQMQSFAVHAAILRFNDGSGIRYISEYSESLDPVSNRTLFYTFQGLTADGATWVAVTLPITNPVLPATKRRCRPAIRARACCSITTPTLPK